MKAPALAGNEYEERWRDLSRAICEENKRHEWRTWEGLRVQCARCGAHGIVTMLAAAILVACAAREPAPVASTVPRCEDVYPGDPSLVQPCPVYCGCPDQETFMRSYPVTMPPPVFSK